MSGLHDAIDHGLTALMPGRAPARMITGAPAGGGIVVAGGLALAFVGGVGTMLVGGTMAAFGKPSGAKVAAAGGVLAAVPTVTLAYFYLRPGGPARHMNADGTWS